MSWQQAIKAAQIEHPGACDPNFNWIEKRVSSNFVNAVAGEGGLRREACL